MTNETRNRRRLAMAAAAVVAVIGVAAIAINHMNSDDDAPSAAAGPTVATTTVAPTTVAPTPVGPTTGTFVMSDTRLTFAVPAGWAYYDDWYVSKVNTDPIFGVGFNIVANHLHRFLSAGAGRPPDRTDR